MRVSAPFSETVPCPGSCGTIAVTPFGHKRRPIVTNTGLAESGQPIVTKVDTMYSGTLSIFPTSASKLGLSRESHAAKRRHSPFTDGGVDMVGSRAASETFGPTPLVRDAPLCFATPGVRLPDGLFDATAGIEVLEGRKVTFDFQGMRMWLER